MVLPQNFLFWLSEADSVNVISDAPILWYFSAFDQVKEVYLMLVQDL